MPEEGKPGRRKHRGGAMNALPAADAASRTTEQVVQDLETSADGGLGSAEAKKRLEEIGPNVLDRASGESVLITGLLTTPQALGMAVAMSFSGRISDRIAASGALGRGAGASAGANAGGVARLAEAFVGTFWWAVALSVVALIPALALPRRRRAAKHTILGHCHPMSGNADLQKQATES